jgi:hypothetical protein
MATSIGRGQLKNRVLPAVMHPDSGNLYVGKRGDLHEDIILNNTDLYNIREALLFVCIGALGYWDPHDKKYISRRLVNFDATDLMTKIARIRKFGHE